MQPPPPHIHTCALTHIHKLMHMCAHVHMHTRTRTPAHICTRVHAYPGTRVHACTHTHVHMHSCTCAHMHMHTRTHMHAHMHTVSCELPWTLLSSSSSVAGPTHSSLSAILPHAVPAHLRADARAIPLARSSSLTTCRADHTNHQACTWVPPSPGRPPERRRGAGVLSHLSSPSQRPRGVQKPLPGCVGAPPPTLRGLLGPPWAPRHGQASSLTVRRKGSSTPGRHLVHPPAAETRHQDTCATPQSQLQFGVCFLKLRVFQANRSKDCLFLPSFFFLLQGVRRGRKSIFVRLSIPL